MEHYLTNITIEKVRHLSNIIIELNKDNRQHLFLTGKNGSGKTSILLMIRKYLRAINDGNLNRLYVEYPRWLEKANVQLSNAQNDAERFEKQKAVDQRLGFILKYKDGLDLSFNRFEDLDSAYQNGDFIIAYFSADRKTRLQVPHGVENIKLNESYDLDSDPAAILLKYMVHLKTQQSYARNENDFANAERIQEWFARFEKALRLLFDDESLRIEYNYKDYNFSIIESGKEPFGFEQLSDGYSSVIHILSDMILRMDKNWLLKDGLSNYNVEGIVMIDEIETHLHIELQKKIMPFLTEFFPRVQFIVTTHSPHILNSISNVKIYDLEKRIEMEDLSAFSSGDLTEAYFDTEEYSDLLNNKLKEYKELVSKTELTNDERARRAELRIELKNLSEQLSGKVRDEFEEIEMYRGK